MSSDFSELTSLDAPLPFGPAPFVVDIFGSRFLVEAPAVDADLMRLVPGAQHLRGRGVWSTPTTMAQVSALSLLFGDRLRPTPAVLDHVRVLVLQAEQANQLRESEPPTSHEFDPRLRPFQVTGVQFILHAGSALLGDDMGLGKTVQAIACMRATHDGTKPNLVVTTKSMTRKFASEVEIWWPEAEVFVIEGTPKKRASVIAAGIEACGVLVINHDGLRAHTCLAPWGGRTLTDAQREPRELNATQFGTMVIDEVHKIKDPKALVTMAAHQLGKQADRRIGMSGTIITRSTDDLWSPMKWVASDEYGSRTQFQNLWCFMQEDWTGRSQNLGLLPDRRPAFDRFFRSRFIRREKAEVLTELPARTVTYLPVELTPPQRKLYDLMVKERLAVVNGELLFSTNEAVNVARLRQIACGMPVIEDGQVVALAAPSAKLAVIHELMEEAPDEPLVIYGTSRKFIELIASDLGEHQEVGLITGRQSGEERERTVQRFQAGEINVILGTMGAGAEGITLTRAQRMIIAQQDWSWATNSQAIDRLHRIGQTGNVEAIILVATNTADVSTVAVNLQKMGRLQDITEDESTIEQILKGQYDLNHLLKEAARAHASA